MEDALGLSSKSARVAKARSARSMGLAAELEGVGVVYIFYGSLEGAAVAAPEIDVVGLDAGELGGFLPGAAVGNAADELILLFV